MDALNACLAGLPFKFEIRIQPIFLFEDPIDPFGQGILGAVILLGHAHFQSRLLHPLHIGVGCILTSPIGVVNGALVRHGEAGFRFFAFTPFGVPILVLGILYMVIARRWLPAKRHRRKWWRHRAR